MNKISLHVVAVLLSAVSFSTITPVVPAQAKQTVQQQQQEQDDIKSGIAGNLLGITLIGAVGSYLAGRPAIQGTGLSVGIGGSTALISLSLIMEEKKSQALRSMAVTFPIICVLGKIIASDAVIGKDGLFAKYGPFGIDKVALNATKGDRDALFLATGVATYIAIKPHLDKFSNFVSNKIAEGYEKIASEMR
jgi:hypothetical protein